MYVFNLINLTNLCRLLAIFFNAHKTFHRCLNVVFVRVICFHDTGQHQINVETMLCMYTLKFTTLNNVKLSQINVVILNAEFHNVDQCRNNVLYMTISKKLKRAKNIFELQKKMIHLINNTCFRL